MKTTFRVLFPATAARLLMALLVVHTLLSLPLPISGAQSPPPPAAVFDGVSTAVHFDISPPLRDMQPAAYTPTLAWEDLDRPSAVVGPLDLPEVDPVVQTTVGPGEIPAPILSFDGFSNQLTYTPPDPVGDVGPNHYVAMANVHFAIYNKSGTLLYGPVPNNTLWSGFGGDCETDNSGDPIVVYDQLANRWMLTQLTSSGPTYFNCVALSMTGDPTGQYYRWAFQTPGFPDYPKYGVWPDAYYISTRESSIGVYALNRAQMLAGNPSPQVVSFHVPQDYNAGNGLLPADLDGTTLPPAGSPEIFMGTMDDGGGLGAPQDALTVWRFHVDWASPGNSTFVLAATLPTAPFDSIFPCAPTSRECIPQPGTTVKVDILSYRQRPIWRLAYRNFGTHEALVTNQSVEASTGMAGIRWYEVRDPNGTPTIYQQGTYNPGATDGIHRWMASIAMDRDGNMLLGYSASNGIDTYPSSWYTGRLASDPLGQMAQGEGVFVNGLGSQLSSGHRWGDYTSMNIDPVDDCTFWYINEYYPVTHNTAWRLRIGAVKFPSCGVDGADLLVHKADTPDPVAPGGILTYTLSITNAGPNAVPNTVTVADTLPAGVIVNSFTAPGWSCGPQVGRQFDCTRAGLPLGSYQIQLRTTAPAAVGYITNTVHITSTYADYNPTNNTSRARTLVDGRPDAGDDTYSTPEDVVLDVPAPGVRSNDTDPDGGTLTVTLGIPPAHGALTLAFSGAFVYTPTLNYNGSDSFTYVLSDGYLTATATVEIDVVPVNDPPTAQDDAYTTPEDAPLVVAAPGVLDNDDDVDGDSLTAVVLTDPQHGAVTLAADGSFVYTPTADYNGTDSFTYAASDGVLTATATVNLSITSLPDAPLAADDAYTTTEDTPLVAAAPGVLANDGDPDGDSLAAAVGADPQHGTLALNADGSFTYTPDLDYSGADSFTYLASDGALTATATVYLTVAPANDDPVAAAGPDQEGEEGTDLAFTGAYTDAEGQAVEIVWDFGDGTTLTGTLTPTHAYGDEGVYTVTLTVADDEGGVGVDTLVVTVANVAPLLAPLPDMEVDLGQAVTLTGSFADPGWLDAHGVTIDWGDGVTETHDLAAGVYDFSATYAYAAAGIYTATVRVADYDGGVDVETLLVNVIAPQERFRIYLPVLYK